MKASALTTRQIVRATWRALGRAPALLAALAFGIPMIERGVECVAAALATDENMPHTWAPPWLLFAFVLTCFQHTAISLVVARTKKERREPVLALLRLALTRTPSVIIVLFSVRVSIAAGMLLVAPGLVALASLFVAVPIAACEGLQPRWAIVRSRLVTREATYAVLGATFVWLLVVLVTYVMLVAIVAASMDARTAEAVVMLLFRPTPLPAALGAVGQGVLSGLSAIGSAVVYRAIGKPARGALGERVARAFE